MISVKDTHYKTLALEGVLSTLIAGLSVSNPGLIDEVNRVINENISEPGKDEGLVRALIEVRNSINRIGVER